MELENIEALWQDRLNQEIEDKNYLENVMGQEVETLRSQITVLEDALIVNDSNSKDLISGMARTLSRSTLDELNHIASSNQIFGTDFQNNTKAMTISR